MLKSGKFNQVPYVTGTTSAEGKTNVWGVKNDPAALKKYDKNREEFVPKDLGLQMGSPESLAVTKKIMEQYFGNKSISQDTIPELVAFESDFSIVIGVHRAVKLQLALGTSPVYKFLFSYQGRFSLSEFLFMDYQFKGAAHGDDIGYLFKINEVNITLPTDSEEFKVIDKMTKLWTDFAKTGNQTTNFDINWEPFTEENQTYLNIDKSITIEDWSNFEPENIALWDSIYEDIDNIQYRNKIHTIV